MRVISIENVQEGMEVARSIYGSSGEVLLAEGIKLTSRYIERLNNLGIIAIYIYDEATADIEINDIVSERTRLEAIKMTKDVMCNIKVNPQFDVHKVNDIVNSIIDELLANKELVVSMVEIRALNDYTFGHSVNVAILSVITGIALGYDQNQLRKLATGALFHDIGKTLVPEQVLTQVSPSTTEEETLLKQHTTLGFNILRKVPAMSLTAAHVAFQHHEKYDGTGFPRNLQGEEISEFARIVSIADIYDRMTTGWVGKNNIQPFQALELIIANRGTFFDPEIVSSFINVIAIFPLGTKVRLNSGETGVVIQTYPNYPTRPIVRVLVDGEGRKVIPSYDITLSKTPNLYIAGIVEED